MKTLNANGAVLAPAMFNWLIREAFGANIPEGAEFWLHPHQSVAYEATLGLVQVTPESITFKPRKRVENGGDVGRGAGPVYAKLKPNLHQPENVMTLKLNGDGLAEVINLAEPFLGF